MPAIPSEKPQTPERIEWIQSDALPGVQIMAVDNCARRWRIFHETYTTCTGLALEDPSLEWRYRGKLHRINSVSAVMLMEPGEVHANTRITTPASFRVMMIPPSVVQRAAEELGMRTSCPHFRVAQVGDSLLYRALVALHASLERPSTTLERHSRFAACLQWMLEQCAEEPPRPAAHCRGHPAIRRARAFLAEHITDPISLEQLAAAAGNVSRFWLVRAFTAQEGVPPHAFQIGLRMARARALLSAGMSVTRVSAELGFADQSHFGRHFRQAAGVNPIAFATATAVARRARTF
jgi:AraC-like DNA-binding protein